MAPAYMAHNATRLLTRFSGDRDVLLCRPAEEGRRVTRGSLHDQLQLERGGITLCTSSRGTGGEDVYHSISFPCHKLTVTINRV
ncbi:hypothetical protein EYF80_065732 [Liparis tanakae]|uniref:Uncharacterized protein n=1 Tax=Liparis tanakae TaxID=230148 RepID=A0A4Z2E5U4_9TELE|nr:hypothetical protein EYF80_065732 [Liparis tanakae]